MTTATKEFKGYHLAFILICFFGVIITVNFSMAYLAKTNWTGLVVKNSYVASQQFNGDLEAAKLQKKSGWASSFKYQDGTIQLSLKDAKGNPVYAREILAKIGRPAFEQLDHEVILSAYEEGLYKAEDILQPGLWKIVFTTNIAGQPYRRDVRLLVNASGVGRIQ